MKQKGILFTAFFLFMTVSCFGQTYPQPADYDSSANYGWNEVEQDWDKFYYTVVKRNQTIDRLKIGFRRTPGDGRWLKQRVEKEYGTFEFPDSSSMFALNNRDTFLMMRSSMRYDEHRNIIERLETRQYLYQLSPMSRWKYVNEYDGQQFVRGHLYFDLEAPFDNFYKVGETYVTYDSLNRQDSMLVYRRSPEDSTANLILSQINFQRYYGNGLIKRKCTSNDSGATFNCTYFTYDSLSRVHEILDSIDTRFHSLTVQTYNGDREVPSQISVFQTESMDSLLEEHSRRVYTYDQEGRLTESIQWEWNHVDQELEPRRRQTYYYQEESIPLVIAEEETQSHHIFPNPSSGMIQVQPLDLEANYRILVSDISGNVHYDQSAEGKQTIDLSHLSAGLYIININQGVQLSSSRLILE